MVKKIKEEQIFPKKNIAKLTKFAQSSPKGTLKNDKKINYSKSPKPSSKKKTIMIVDDEENICSLVKELLEEEGFKVEIALNGAEALAKLKKALVDLVLVDFFMPEMNGRELCEEIRKDTELKNLKLAFLTVAQFGKGGFKEIKKLGILDYIQKPFDNRDLVNRVKKIVG